MKALLWKGERSAITSADIPVGTGELKTRRIATNLHVAVVTVDLTAVAALDPGELYSYNLTFAFTGGQMSDLKGEHLLEDQTGRLEGVDDQAPRHKALGFIKDELPTFLAPPRAFVGATAADGLRVAHCSCRRAGGGTFDAMAGIAALVKQADRRPHQLYMTGDQVYADDISRALLGLVISLGSDITGTPQPLPGFPPDPRTGASGSTPVTGAGLPGNLANLPPLRRKWLMWQLAGFTGSDTENHAITFGEFAALHLLAWSPRVWRAIPAFADVFKAPGIPGGAAAPDPAIAPWLNRPWFCSAENPRLSEDVLKRNWGMPTVNVEGFESFNAAAHHLARYAGVTPLAAQVLANTPTYMIFDDHEIADDWNLNGRWATRVYNRQWGRYVVRNGLMAYTVMQGWGNDPAQFAIDKPGRKLLDAIPAAIAGQTPATDVDILLGFDKPTPAQPKRVTFNYSCEAETYKVVVLDTRTHRAINTISSQSPNLIDNLDEQLPASADPPAKPVLVLVSAVPVFSPVVVEQIGQPLAQLAIDNLRAFTSTTGDIPGFTASDDPQDRAGCGGLGERGAEKYDREGWSANEKGFEALIARLAGYKSVVILSGDVHYASTTTLDYWTKSGTQARLVQCISSPAKNIFKRQVEELVRKMGSLQRAAEVPMERLAWRAPVDPSILIRPGARLSLARRSRLRKTPALVPTSPWPAGSKLPDAADKGPDWRWRIQTVVDVVTEQSDLPGGIDGLRLEPVPPAAEDLPAGDRLVAVSTLHQLRLLQNRPLLRRLVFAANFGTVQFEQSQMGVNVVHRLYSPVSAKPFGLTERAPRPAVAPELPSMTFGPHTVHRTSLVMPAETKAPDIIADPPDG